MDRLKEMLSAAVDCGVLSLCFGLLSVMIEPCDSFKQSFQKIASAVVVGVVVGWFITDWQASKPVHDSIVAASGYFGQTILFGSGRLLKLFFADPFSFVKKLRGKDESKDN